MSSVEQTAWHRAMYYIRDWFAESLGVGPERKEEIYLEVARSASLRDVSYWLQVLFSAGIATLGLVLNSPAVIIGAMLISPLMGPILANGLALASGDLILGVRSIVNLVLSCLLAVVFALLLVYFLPFKEQTAEIAARAHPNSLDLIIALFSGAVGSIAICKQVKGVMTSIPGVAIAVALMPPLCVMGFGIGVAISDGGPDGKKAAIGGGLLFLTNLVAITFTSMLVFLALHIDTNEVRATVRQWRKDSDQVGRLMRIVLIRLPGAEKLKKVGSLPGRIILVLVIVLLVFIPLSRSFSELKSEIGQKKSENRIRQVATEVWEQNYSTLPNGEQRTFLGRITMTNISGKVTLLMRIFTIKPLTVEEKKEYTRQVAERLNVPVSAVNTQLVEIPTASSELLTRAGEPSKEDNRPEAANTVAHLQEEFTNGLEITIGSLLLPPPAKLVDVEVIIREGVPSHYRLFYLSNRDIEKDAQTLIVENLKTQVEDPSALVSLERIEDSVAPLNFVRNQATISQASSDTFERVDAILRAQPKLHLEIVAGAEPNEREGIAKERDLAIREFLFSKYQIPSDRITTAEATDGQRFAIMNIKMNEVKK